MIDNLIRLFSTAPENERTERTLDRGLAGDFSAVTGAFDDISGLYTGIKNLGDDDKLFG